MLHSAPCCTRSSSTMMVMMMAMTPSLKASSRPLFIPVLSRGAGRGIPAPGVRELLEVRARGECAGEVLRILDPDDDRQPRIAVRHRVQVPVLRDDGPIAVRRAVLADVAGSQVGRDDLQAARSRVPLRHR